MTTIGAIQQLVTKNQGLVDRRIFSDKDIYQQELEQVFGRCWLFLGHESQILKPNDFVATYMAEDPVLLTRDSKDKLHAFLNMCRHRGNRICRADFGNAPSFMCTYHGWTFATDGKLVGVPGYKEAYFEELDRSQWGLVEVAHITSYKGLVFGTWDASAPSLVDYLGNMAWYLDMTIDGRNGGTEVIGGAQKWVLNTNWKFPTDNIGGDSYHFGVTHGSVDKLRKDTVFGPMSSHGKGSALSQSKPPETASGAKSWQASPGNGHGVVSIGGSGYGIGRRPSDPLPGEIKARYYVQNLDEFRRRLGNIRADNAGSSGFFSIFPNFSWNGTARTWHPRGPMKTEAWLYLMVDKDAPVEVKDAIRKYETRSHGPNGGIEIDDGDNYIACTALSRSLIGRKYLQNVQLRLGQEVRREEFPGTLVPSPGELNQRDFYEWWAKVMDAPSWDGLIPKSR